MKYVLSRKSILASYYHLTVLYFCLDIFPKYPSQKSSVSVKTFRGIFLYSSFLHSQESSKSKSFRILIPKTQDLLCTSTQNKSNLGKISGITISRIGGSFSRVFFAINFYPPYVADFYFNFYTYENIHNRLYKIMKFRPQC